MGAIKIELAPHDMIEMDVWLPGKTINTTIPHQRNTLINIQGLSWRDYSHSQDFNTGIHTQYHIIIHIIGGI